MQQNNITSNNRIHVIRNDRVDALDYQHMIKNAMHIRRPLMIKLKKMHGQLLNTLYYQTEQRGRISCCSHILLNKYCKRTLQFAIYFLLFCEVICKFIFRLTFYFIFFHSHRTVVQFFFVFKNTCPGTNQVLS